MPEPSMTANESRVLEDYQSLMTEVSIRLDCVHQLINEDQPYPQGIVKEFCFLQFRMICELIALGCLLAHGDIKATQTRRFQKMYHADKIMEMLGELHPEFFPDPARGIADQGKPVIVPAAGGLTKDELSQLYGLCGAVLHRGSLGRYLAKRPTPETDKAAAKVWVEKLTVLLREHIVVTVGLNRVIFCRMTDQGVNVYLALAK